MPAIIAIMSGPGPQFLKFFWPVIDALRELGGAAKPSEVIDLVIELTGISDDERAALTAGGNLRVDNQIHWARNYLVWAGFLDGSTRGTWALAPAGWEVDTAFEDGHSAHELFKQVRQDKKEEWGTSESQSTAEAGEDEDAIATPLDAEESEELNLTTALRATLVSLSPTGFEHLCRRLLTQLGLVQLRTVGQAGDRGIDVEGHLRLNAVVSFRVGVQCKLYSADNKVVPRQIREFQGALGPFDRGIFMTTSIFTQQAEEQATSPGYKPIDLIDGGRLVDLLQEHRLGIKQVTVVDDGFFDPFRLAV